MKFKNIIILLFSSLNKKGFAGLKNILLTCINLFLEPIKLSSEPLLVQIEPTTYCNLECKMCINPRNNRLKCHMRLNGFKRILDSSAFIQKISLVGAGEPLLNPDLFNIISYGKSKNILIGFATNGMLLNEDNCKKIIRTRVNWVNISIDSTNKNKYEKIRKGANFEVLLENIKRLIALKAKENLPLISLWVVIMKDNLNELPHFISFAKNIGIRQISAQLQHSWGNDDMKESICDYASATFYKDLRRVLKQTKIEATRKGVNFVYVNIPDNSLERSCKWPWRSCYITVEGFVTPCCMHGTDPNILNFGNIFEEKFDKIWNNKLYQNFRQQLKSRVIPPLCIGCPSYYRTI